MSSHDKKSLAVSRRSRAKAIAAGSTGSYARPAGGPRNGKGVPVRLPSAELISLASQLDGPILGPIGQRIVQQIESGRSVSQIAAEIGTTQATLWRTLMHQTDPKESLLRKVCEHLGLSLQPEGKA